MVPQWRQVASEIFFNIVSYNDLASDSTRPLLEPMLTNYQSQDQTLVKLE